MILLSKLQGIVEITQIRAGAGIDPSKSEGHLGISFDLSNGSAVCELETADPDSYICCWIQFPERQSLPCVRKSPGSWHEILIEISELDPLIFNFSFDGQIYRRPTPNEPGETKQINGVTLNLISYSEGRSWGYLDYIEFGSR